MKDYNKLKIKEYILKNYTIEDLDELNKECWKLREPEEPLIVPYGKNEE